jgi:hypothetical protein
LHPAERPAGQPERIGRPGQAERGQHPRQDVGQARVAVAGVDGGEDAPIGQTATSLRSAPV